MENNSDTWWQTLESLFTEQNESTLWWNDIRNIFERLKMMAKEPDYRTQLSSENIAQSLKVLIACEKKLVSTNITGELNKTSVSCLKAGTEVVRFLRNSSAGVPQNQEYIVTNGVIHQVLKVINMLLKPCFQESDERTTVNDTIKGAVQMMGNVTVGNTLMQDYVWKQCYPDLFLLVMTSASLEIQNCMCMVIFNSMSPQQRLDLVSSHQGLKIMSQILHLCSDHEVELEWGYFIIETLVKNGHMGDLYKGLEFDPSARIILLDLIQVHFTTGKRSNPNPDNKEQSTGVHWVVPEESLVHLANEFEQVSDVAFFHKECDHSMAENMLDALLISRLLSLLSKATGLHLSSLQSCIQLLHKAIDLLHQTNKPEHRERFSNISFIEKSQDSSTLSPIHGFKRDLVRLIANMCYKHKANQDEVRFKEGIPLLLDHCNIDEYNPYICQWAVFAIRNALENNIENQKLVATVNKQGLADNSRLREFGVDVKETGDGRIKIVQKNKN